MSGRLKLYGLVRRGEPTYRIVVFVLCGLWLNAPSVNQMADYVQEVVSPVEAAAIYLLLRSKQYDLRDLLRSQFLDPKKRTPRDLLILDDGMTEVSGEKMEGSSYGRKELEEAKKRTKLEWAVERLKALVVWGYAGLTVVFDAWYAWPWFLAAVWGLGYYFLTRARWDTKIRDEGIELTMAEFFGQGARQGRRTRSTGSAAGHVDPGNFNVRVVRAIYRSLQDLYDSTEFPDWEAVQTLFQGGFAPNYQT